jgi:hypothetical protein
VLLTPLQAIEEAIARGLPRVEAGAQGEHKLQRGYLPNFTYSAHYIADPTMRSAVATFLDKEDQQVRPYLPGRGCVRPVCFGCVWKHFAPDREEEQFASWSGRRCSCCVLAVTPAVRNSRAKYLQLTSCCR